MSYRVILAGRYDVGDFAEEISLDDSMDEIALRANIRLAVLDGLPGIAPGQEIRITGPAPDNPAQQDLWLSGIVWECQSDYSGAKHLSVTVYDRSIYLAKSEDERLMPAGQTADQRLKAYAKAWQIPIDAAIPDTKIKLSRNIKRAQSIMSMIQDDLRETAAKGGELFRVRMTPGGLGIVRLGSNRTVWELESLEQLTQTRTLEGAVTQVKVLGTAKDGEKLSPVLAVEKKDTEKYGTLQKILEDGKITSAAEAKAAARNLLLGMQETFSLTATSIPSIRAGDRVRLNGMDLLVTRAAHRLGDRGSMDLELAAEDKVRRDYYG